MSAGLKIQFGLGMNTVCPKNQLMGGIGVGEVRSSALEAGMELQIPAARRGVSVSSETWVCMCIH